MPLPLLFIIPAAAAGLAGVGKGIKAAVDTKEASDTNKRAQRIADNAASRLNVARNASSKAINSLGEKKLFILNGDVKRFINLFERIKNVDFSDSVGLQELNKFKIDRQSFAELKEMTNVAADVAQGVAGGAAAGVLTAFGAWGGATTFAAASTGTAIASLSGAAATNATLAFFGGGSLAAGGLGVAGGAAVLGGLVAGPALAVLGFVWGAKASKNLDNSYSNLAEAKKYAAEYAVARTACNAIRRRAYMFYRLLIRLDARFSPLLDSMADIISFTGSDYRNYSRDEKHTVAAACSLVGTIKNVLDTPILTKDGKLTEESEQIGKETAAYLEAK